MTIELDVVADIINYCADKKIKPNFLINLKDDIKKCPLIIMKSGLIILKNDTVAEIYDYCESESIYDKLGKYNDFYYKLKNKHNN